MQVELNKGEKTYPQPPEAGNKPNKEKQLSQQLPTPDPLSFSSGIAIVT